MITSLKILGCLCAGLIGAASLSADDAAASPSEKAPGATCSAKKDTAEKKGCAAGQAGTCSMKKDAAAGQAGTCPMKKDSAACPTGACAATQVKSDEGFTLLTSGDMKKIVDAKGAILLDARSGKYDDGQRIPGAKSLNDSSTAEEIAKIVPAKDSAIVTYCSNLKCPASGKLAKHLKELGYTNIKEYPEGIQGWIAGGNPVEKAAK